MATKRARATNVDRLRKAGLLHARQRLTKGHEAKLNRLSSQEVTSLVRVVKKHGKKKGGRGVSRAWIV
jgi:hypothetical protein